MAAVLANGVRPTELGNEIKNPVMLKPLVPERLEKGRIKARIIHIDRFGNCITNLSREDLTATMIEEGAYISINGKRISEFRNFFTEGSRKRNAIFCLWGSAGFLELAAMNLSAAKILKAKRGQPAIVRCKNN